MNYYICSKHLKKKKREIKFTAILAILLNYFVKIKETKKKNKKLTKNNEIQKKKRTNETQNFRKIKTISTIAKLI